LNPLDRGFDLDVSRVLLQTEIAKRLSNLIGQVLPYLSQEHQQQVASAADRAKQITINELNTIVGVSLMPIGHFSPPPLPQLSAKSSLLDRGTPADNRLAS